MTSRSRLRSDLLELAERREKSFLDKIEMKDGKNADVKTAESSNFAWYFTVLLTGFLFRIALFYAFQWVWKIIEK